jgi:hypothetical protein
MDRLSRQVSALPKHASDVTFARGRMQNWPGESLLFPFMSGVRGR